MNAFAKATTTRGVLRKLALALLALAICLTASIPVEAAVAAAKKNNGGKKKMIVSSQVHPKKGQGQNLLANNGKPK